MRVRPENTCLTVRPIDGAPFGIEILGADPKNFSEDHKAIIRAAHWRARGLLCFSCDRLLEAEELHALTALFGEHEYAPGLIDGIGKKGSAEERQLSVEEQEAALRARGVDPYLGFIGNLDPHTLEVESVDPKFFGAWEWHTDMSYLEVPPTFSLLHAREVPDEGGDTGFCNQVMAARQLPADLRRRILGRQLKHDSTYGSSGVLRPGMSAPASPLEALGHAHPILRRIPDAGCEALFLGRRTNGYILGMELSESEALLDELWMHATQERFCYCHKWQAGQVVVWDNRMLLHSRRPMDDSKNRFMWRTQTRGEPVVPVEV